ncbi:MAG: hypothetical protein ACK56I_12410, partial [bacterium]
DLDQPGAQVRAVLGLESRHVLALAEPHEFLEGDDRSHQRLRQLRLLHAEAHVDRGGDGRFPPTAHRTRLGRDGAVHRRGLGDHALGSDRTGELDHRAVPGDEASARRGDVGARDALLQGEVVALV